GKDRGPKRVAETPEKVVAVLLREALPELGGLPCSMQTAAFRPPDQTAVQDERLPRPARRGELGVGGAVAPVIGHRFQSPADTNPHRRVGAHLRCNGG